MLTRRVPGPRFLPGLALALLLLVAPAAAQTFEGRRYHLSPGAHPGPLILALHGGGGTGRHLQRTSPIDAAAAAAGLTVVYPDAPDRIWNDGRWTAQARPELAQRDDAGHLMRLAQHLLRGAGDRRLFVIGHSNGGGMALRLACTAPDRIAGIAIVATKLLRDAPCDHVAPVPAILFHGTRDRLAPHDGNRTPRQTVRMGAILSSDATLAELARRNRCTGPPLRQVLPPLPVSGVIPRIEDWQGCAQPLRRVTLIGAGHGFPGGSTGPLAGALTGPALPDYDAAAAALAFWGLTPAPR